MKLHYHLYLLLILSSVFAFASSQQTVALRESSLLISTLDGTLHAVGQRSGVLKWSVRETPLLKLPSIESIAQQLKRTFFLADPKDGSLYLYNGLSSEGSTRETLEKMPFTISELVSASPCRSTDGKLYTGKKTDEWITINSQTGEKMDVLNWETPMCPSNSNGDNNNLLFLGKREYHLSIFDLESKEKTWNLTFIDYSSSATLSIPQSAYDLLHLTSSTNGRIATIDLTIDDNKLLWTHQFSSPIVAIYQFNDGNSPVLRRIPFSTIGGNVHPLNIRQNNPLFPSLYVGEMNNSNAIYAISTLVDITLTALMPSKKMTKPMLEGPDNKLTVDSSFNEYYNSLVFGYYEYPEIVKSEIIPQFQITQSPIQLLTSELKQTENMIFSTILPINNATYSDEEYNHLELWSIYTFGFAISVCVIALSTCLFTRSSQKKKQFELNTSLISVGKISFDTKNIIGRGSSGTCVYKGLFENKQSIAVKRILTEFFVVANKEIELLRSFQHPNIIRYYTTEADNYCRYIAIELAEYTLADYVEKKNCDFGFDTIDDIKILYQCCNGLAHMHSLNVIHRDIKPHNILISLSEPPNRIRKVMISDFGVSKVLSSNNSFSTGMSATLKGTEGWIAPEVLKANMDRTSLKPSKPVDIFSLGCLFYYILTSGKHPFGDSLQTQSNILIGMYDINLIKEEQQLCYYNLIQAMINHDPNARPLINSVIKHPMFWEPSKSLQFLQDVSDRIEKEATDSQVVLDLEKGGFDVCKGDWRRHISIELQSDLRKFRSYKGSSVRDLLRAMRNKRHHYRELPEELQQSLGSIPNEFVNYFTSRFPRLLIHSYIALQSCKNEHIFESYYERDGFNFETLPYSGIKWFLKNADTFKPNGVGSDDSLAAVNWKSCKRKGSPIKSMPKEDVPDMSPKFDTIVNN